MMSVKSKNIHVIPTDKPSRLGYLTKKGKEVYKDLRLFDKPMPIILDSENQNIYITNNEEIKDDEWHLHYYEGKPVISKSHNGASEYINLKAKQFGYNKIILTTDLELQKDGVQAIDDEFLEWFVKNPSCEKVDVDKAEHGMYKDDVYYKLSNKIFYKIITPKEEQTKCYCGHTTYCDCGPKQETLEEAAEENFKGEYVCNGIDIVPAWREGFIIDAKWQQERMYSEEEVKKIIKLSCEQGMLIQRTINDKVKIPYTRIKDFTIKMFEQFKKL